MCLCFQGRKELLVSVNAVLSPLSFNYLLQSNKIVIYVLLLTLVLDVQLVDMNQVPLLNRDYFSFFYILTMCGHYLSYSWHPAEMLSYLNRVYTVNCICI